MFIFIWILYNIPTLKNFRFIYIINAHFIINILPNFLRYFPYIIIILRYFPDLFRSILNLHRHFKYVKKLSNEKVLDIRELDENFLTYYKIPRYIEWYNRPFSSIIICWFHPLSIWYPLHVQWNLSKLNCLGTKFCVQNRQVFGLYRLN